MRTSNIDYKIRMEKEMIVSLVEAISEAGGDPLSVIRDDMTLKDIVAALAPNRIRFFYDKETQNSEEEY